MTRLEREGWERLSEGFTKAVNVMRPVDFEQGVLTLQLEPAFVRPVNHPLTGMVEHVEIEIYFGTKPEDVAERYRHAVIQENASFTDVPGRVGGARGSDRAAAPQRRQKRALEPPGRAPEDR